MSIKKISINYSQFAEAQIAKSHTDLAKIGERYHVDDEIFQFAKEGHEREISNWLPVVQMCLNSLRILLKRHNFVVRDGPFNWKEIPSNIWIYQDVRYEVDGAYSDEEKKLLILEFADKERQQFERLKEKFSGEQAKIATTERKRIPEDVRIAVWRRDQGQCSRCGNRESLEYDHIIPHSRGGSDTVRNIELLCERCNREKSNRIQ